MTTTEFFFKYLQECAARTDLIQKTRENQKETLELELRMSFPYTAAAAMDLAIQRAFPTRKLSAKRKVTTLDYSELLDDNRSRPLAFRTRIEENETTIYQIKQTLLSRNSTSADIANMSASVIGAHQMNQRFANVFVHDLVAFSIQFPATLTLSSEKTIAPITMTKKMTSVTRTDFRRTMEFEQSVRVETILVPDSHYRVEVECTQFTDVAHFFGKVSTFTAEALYRTIPQTAELSIVKTLTSMGERNSVIGLSYGKFDERKSTETIAYLTKPGGMNLTPRRNGGSALTSGMFFAPTKTEKRAHLVMVQAIGLENLAVRPAHGVLARVFPGHSLQQVVVQSSDTRPTLEQFIPGLYWELGMYPMRNQQFISTRMDWAVLGRSRQMPLVEGLAIARKHIPEDTKHGEEVTLDLNNSNIVPNQRSLQAPVQMTWANLDAQQPEFIGNHVYTVLVKYDGERRLLMFIGGMIWLVYHEVQYQLIGRMTNNMPLTVLDTEVIRDETGNVCTIYVFDALVIEGALVADKSFTDRYMDANGFVKARFAASEPFCQDGMECKYYLATKTTWTLPAKSPLSTMEDFADMYMNKLTNLFNDAARLTHIPQDGLIFMHNHGYFYTPAYKQKDRNAFRPSTLKWKPKKLLTADLLYKSDTQLLSLGTFDVAEHKRSYKNNLDGKVLDKGTINDLVPDNIYSFQYQAFAEEQERNYMNLGTDLFPVYSSGRKPTWVGVGNRPDRSVPNSQWQVDLVMKKPIFALDLCGYGSELFREISKRQKRKIIAAALAYNHDSETLVDVGTGNVYNVEYYRSAGFGGKMWAIEPRQDFADDLQRHASTNDKDLRVHHGTWANMAAKPKPNIVLAMFSITFMFLQKEPTDEFINMLQDVPVGGCFAYIGLNRDSIAKQFPTESQQETKVEIVLPDKSTRFSYDWATNTCAMFMANSTVEEANEKPITEYPAYNMDGVMARHGFVVAQTHMWSTNTFLRSEWTKLLRCYAGAIYKRVRLTSVLPTTVVSSTMQLSPPLINGLPPPDMADYKLFAADTALPSILGYQMSTSLPTVSSNNLVRAICTNFGIQSYHDLMAQASSTVLLEPLLSKLFDIYTLDVVILMSGATEETYQNQLAEIQNLTRTRIGSPEKPEQNYVCIHKKPYAGYALFWMDSDRKLWPLVDKHPTQNDFQGYQKRNYPLNCDFNLLAWAYRTSTRPFKCIYENQNLKTFWSLTLYKHMIRQLKFSAGDLIGLRHRYAGTESPEEEAANIVNGKYDDIAFMKDEVRDKINKCGWPTTIRVPKIRIVFYDANVEPALYVSACFAAIEAIQEKLCIYVDDKDGTYLYFSRSSSLQSPDVHIVNVLDECVIPTYCTAHKLRTSTDENEEVEVVLLCISDITQTYTNENITALKGHSVIVLEAKWDVGENMYTIYTSYERFDSRQGKSPSFSPTGPSYLPPSPSFSPTSPSFNPSPAIKVPEEVDVQNFADLLNEDSMNADMSVPPVPPTPSAPVPPTPAPMPPAPVPPTQATLPVIEDYTSDLAKIFGEIQALPPVPKRRKR